MSLDTVPANEMQAIVFADRFDNVIGFPIASLAAVNSGLEVGHNHDHITASSDRLAARKHDFLLLAFLANTLHHFRALLKFDSNSVGASTKAARFQQSQFSQRFAAK